MQWMDGQLLTLLSCFFVCGVDRRLPSPVGTGDTLAPMDSQRALLDQLMGAHRDLPAEEAAKRKRNFWDADIDKHFLCGLSPVTLFKNTKSELPVGTRRLRTLRTLSHAWTFVGSPRCKCHFIRLCASRVLLYRPPT